MRNSPLGRTGTSWIVGPSERFHITMKLTVLHQYALGLIKVDENREKAFSRQYQRSLSYSFLV